MKLRPEYAYGVRMNNEQLIEDLMSINSWCEDTLICRTIDRAIAALSAMTTHSVVDSPEYKLGFQAGTRQAEPNQWKSAVLDELINTFALTGEHVTEPYKAVKAAIEANVQMALDPQISEGAQALYDKGFELRGEFICPNCGLRTDPPKIDAGF